MRGPLNHGEIGEEQKKKADEARKSERNILSMGTAGPGDKNNSHERGLFKRAYSINKR